MEFALRVFLKKLSPAGPEARLSILIYHRVLEEVDPLFPDQIDAARFAAQMGMLSRVFKMLPLSEAVKCLKSGTLPARAACITFDDGYADNAEVALPILRRHGIPATFFISTGYLNGGIMFNDRVIETVRRLAADVADFPGLGIRQVDTLARRRAVAFELISMLKYRSIGERQEYLDRLIERSGITLPGDLMMTTQQVRKLADAGMELGGHTVNHPILSGLDLRSARAEIEGGRAALEEMTGQAVRTFAYPNGIPGKDYTTEHARLVAEMGFDAAVSTARGAARRGSDLFQLPRFTPWDIPISRFSVRLAGNLLQSRIATA